MKKDIRLYNVLFPFWMLLLFPQLWWIVLPGNFIIDSLVLMLGMAWLKVSDRGEFYKKHILKIFGFGLLADIIGAGYMLFMITYMEFGRMGDELPLTLPALVISAVLIFVFNYFVTLRKIAKAERVKFALLFAIITAPYTFLVPSSWLYG